MLLNNFPLSRVFHLTAPRFLLNSCHTSSLQQHSSNSCSGQLRGEGTLWSPCLALIRDWGACPLLQAHPILHPQGLLWVPWAPIPVCPQPGKTPHWLYLTSWRQKASGQVAPCVPGEQGANLSTTKHLGALQTVPMGGVALAGCPEVPVRLQHG